MMSSQAQRIRRRTRAADPKRFEVRKAVPGRRGRLLATAATPGAARLAVKSLLEEGELGLVIRDAATGPPAQALMEVKLALAGDTMLGRGVAERRH